MAICLNYILLQSGDLIKLNFVHIRIYKFYFVCEPGTESTAAKGRRLGHISCSFEKWRLTVAASLMRLNEPHDVEQEVDFKLNIAIWKICIFQLVFLMKGFQ